MPGERGSISVWIAGLKTGEHAAVQALWLRYSAKLLKAAEKQIGGFPTSMSDEEDIAQSVFYSLYRGATSNRFNNIQNRDELWWLLLELTHSKVVDRIRRESAQKRGGGRVHLESSIRPEHVSDEEFRLDTLIGSDPTPDFLVALDEENHRLMLLLDDDEQRRIASLRIEGFTVPEVAVRLGISLRKTERKLGLIRSRWACEFTSDDGCHLN